MKKISAFLLIFIVLAVVWWGKTRHTAAPIVNTTTPPTPEQILANDYEKISRNLKPENTSNDEWKKINTYSLTPEKMITKENAKAFFTVAKNNIPDINSCLKKDFCGMEVRSADDAYFDDEKTPAHILLSRNLKVMRESLAKDSTLASEVDWDLVRELANSNAEIVSVEALDLISEFDTASVKTDELIKLTEDYKGSAKAEALLRISKKSSNKTALVNGIKEVFAMKDANTAIEVLEKLSEMNLNDDQKADALKDLCSYKHAGHDGNWKMIKSEAKKIYPDFEKLCN